MKLKHLCYSSQQKQGQSQEFHHSDLPVFCPLFTVQKQLQEVSMKKSVLKSSTKFTGKYLCQSLFLATLLKKRLWRRCFPVNFVKHLSTRFFTEHL